MRKLSDDLCLALKAKWRELVKVSGGTDHAAALTGSSISRISEYGSPMHMDRFPRIDQIAHLELDCGIPVITQYIADQHGLDLAPRDNAAPVGIHSHFVKIIKETGEVTSGMAEAMADGKIDETERAKLVKEGLEAIRVLQDMVNELRSNGGLKVVAK